MISTHKYNTITWVDLENPTTDEIATVMKDYSLHPVVAEELLAESSKGKFEQFDDYIYLVLHFPVRNKLIESTIATSPHRSGRLTADSAGSSDRVANIAKSLSNRTARNRIEEREVDFIVGKNFIITTKYDAVEPLHNFSKVFETNSVVDKRGLGKHAGFVLYYMLKRLYGSMLSDLLDIEADLLAAEEKVFSGNEKIMVKVLSELSRELIDIKHVVRGHADVLATLAEVNSEIFGNDFKYYITDIKSEFGKVNEQLNSNKDLLSELRDTNDSLLTTKQNETMKILTMMAFVTFPLSLFADLFSMNTSHAPIVGQAYDFEIILVLMIIGAGAMFSLFKYKKWL